MSNIPVPIQANKLQAIQLFIDLCVLSLFSYCSSVEFSSLLAILFNIDLKEYDNISFKC